MIRWPLVWRSTLDDVREDYAKEYRRVQRETDVATETADWLKTQLRSAEDALVRAGGEHRLASDRHEREMVAAERRYAELLARVQVLAPLHVHTTSAEPVVAEPDPISKVIREQAEGDIQYAKHLRRYARKLREDGFTQDQIVGKLVASSWTSEEIT